LSNPHEFRRAVAAIVASPNAGAWQSGLLASENGSPKPLLANAIHAFRCAPEWHNVLVRDSFACRTIAREETPWGYTGPWIEQQDALAAEWLQHRRIYVSMDIAARAIETVAEENQFHPVREFLDSLEWDRQPRLDVWLVDYAGAVDNPYTRAVGSRWLKSGIARIRKPGCKADHVPILEGAQGIGKTRLCKIIGGSYYTDEIADLGSKDSAMQAAGAWVLELSELDAFQRQEQSRLKAFISRTADRFRPPYGRRIVELPRQCIFIGTINHNAYLRDESGARRFWPVRCGRIDLDSLARDRDQLWAEAQHRYDAGEVWWIDSESLTKHAADEQSSRYEGDPWDEVIQTWLEGRESVSVEQVLTLCVEKPKSQWAQVDKNRIARSLRVIGWERYQRRTGDGREWRYRKIP
jgi:predicted P-loop ATPase